MLVRLDEPCFDDTTSLTIPLPVCVEAWRWHFSPLESVTSMKLGITPLYQNRCEQDSD